MGGGLMQLVAYGAQDVYLTGNPQITFFKVVYRRHTNFAVENIEQVFNGAADFGRRVTCQISRNGDLITKMYLRVILSNFKTNSSEKKWAWVSRVGHALIDSVELEIGGTRIDKQYGNWLNVWYELARNWAHDRGYDIMIGNTAELTTLAQSHDEAILYIPLKFFNNRNDGLAIPLIALQYHEVKLNFEFSQVRDCVNRTANVTDSDLAGLSFASASLFVDYVYLDTEERKRFAQAQHEYLIEQVQFTGAESVNSLTQKFRLNFNHPCKALYWALQLGRYTSGKAFLAYDAKNIDNTRLMATKRAVLSMATYTSDNKLKLQSGASADVAGVLIPANTAHQDFFYRINPIAITNEPDVDNITILGDLLTLDEISSPVSNLKLYNTVDHNPANVVVFPSQRAPAGDGVAAKDVVLRQRDNYGVYLNKTGNPVARVLLQLNGHDRFSERDGNYFNYVQPYQHHSNTPADGLNMYSFALNPEEHQPSGTCNMSRIDNATLNLVFGGNAFGGDFKGTYLAEDSNICIYATNYNVLRIMSGMGGLAYSN
jgi:Large eukaryotic DNA virus major capsid protein/Major capsid protein N-terminus